jgi:glycosyltransferase involved in cell wall biosynthesis
VDALTLLDPAPNDGRIVLVDNGLSQRVGHHAHFAFGLARMQLASKRRFIVLADARMEPELANGPLRARRVFTLGLNQFPAEGDPFERTWNDQQLALRYAEDLSRSGFKPLQTDLLWMPTARAREIAGLAAWLKALRRRPRVALGFHSVIRPLDPGTVSGLLHRMAGRAIDEAVGQTRVLAYATNKPLAQRLSPALGLMVHVAPLPHFYEKLGSEEPLPALPAGDGALVGCLGMQREDKRFGDLPALLGRIHARRPDLRFLVQVGTAGLEPSFAALEANPRIRLIRGYLDDRAFCALIAACDLLLLPYKPERYVARISGPFVFGAVYGTPSVVPAGTWMAGRIAAGMAAGLIYEGDDDALAEALSRGADDRTGLKAQAGALGKPWRNWDGRALVKAVCRWAAGRSLGALGQSRAVS